MGAFDDLVPGRKKPGVFDDLIPEPSSTARRLVADPALSLLKGVIGVPEAAVGVADLVTGGQAGKVAEGLGFRPKEARQIVEGWMTPEQQAANRKVNEADGFLPTLEAILANPSTIPHSVIENVPPMLEGGAIARGLQGGAKVLGKAISPLAAGAAGEGIISAGQNAEQVRQESPTGELTPEQAAILAASGAITGGISAASGGLARRLGISDLDTMLAGGQAASSTKRLPLRALEGFLTEGALEELPQSVQEQIAQNLAQGKPWDEGVGNAAAMGLVTGGVLGGGAAALTRTAPAENAPAPPSAPSAPSAPPAGLLPAPGQIPLRAGEGGDVSDPATTLAALQNADAIYTARAEEEARQAALRTPAGQAGIDATAGPVSAIAATAINTGATQNALAGRQAAIDEATHAAAQEQAKAEAEPGKEPAKVAPPPGQPIAGALFPFATVEAAQKRAQLVSEQTGQEQQVIPHPAKHDAFAVVPKEKPNAVQEPGAGALLQRQPEQTGEAGGERGRVESGQQGQEAAGTGEKAPATVRPGEDVGGHPQDEARAGESAGVEGQVPPENRTQEGGTAKAAPAAMPEGYTAVQDRATGKWRVAGARNLNPISPAFATEAEATRWAAEFAQSKDVKPADPTTAVDVGTPLDQAAHEAAASPTNDKPEPTPGQIDAGNYPKGHLTVHGLDISIENPQGSVRRSKPGAKVAWERTLNDHYGYVRGTVGKDGDHVDVFLKPGTAEDHAGPLYVIDQPNEQGGFDEHKVMIGYASAPEAAKAYKSNYQAGWKVGTITQATPEEFKAWLADGNTKAPFADHAAMVKQKQKAADKEAAQKAAQEKEKARAEAEFERNRASADGTPWEKSRSFTVTLDSGDQVSVEYQGPRDAIGGNTGGVHFKFHGPISSTGYRSDFQGHNVITPQLTPEAWAKRRAEMLYAETQKETGKAEAAKRNALKEAREKALREQQAARTAQADAFNVLVEIPAVQAAAKGDAQQFEAVAIDALGTWLAKQKDGADPERSAALDTLRQVDAKFWESVRKEAAKRAPKEPPKKKLENTGADLRRAWEQAKAAAKAKDEAEGIAALNRLYAATTRADWFANLLPADATPGAQKYVELWRDRTRTFKEWLVSSSKGPLYSLRSRREGDGQVIEGFIRGKRELWSGKARELYRGIIPDAKLDVEDYQAKDAALVDRLALLARAGDQYTTEIAVLTDLLRGKKTVADLSNTMTAALWTEAAKKPSRWVIPNELAPLGKRLITETRLLDADRHLNQLHRLGDQTEYLLAKETTFQDAPRKESLVPPRLEQITRDLPARRDGNVTPQQMKDTFSFADIGFGSWVTSKEDQAHLNHAYDAFMDLAQFMGIEPKAIGFDGKLHFTLGALGHGAKAAATFHPAHPGPNGIVQVINLTKTKGDGTVAHEWFHALDHFLSQDDAGKQAMAQLLTGLRKNYGAIDLQAKAISALRKQVYMQGNKRVGPLDNARAVLEYYRDRGIRSTEYAKNADALGEDYWGNPEEMRARAWEAHIGDNLGGSNNYLVNAAWSGDGMTTPPRFRGTPYPRGEERQHFSRWYKALTDSLVLRNGTLAIDPQAWAEARPKDAENYRESVDAMIAALPELWEQLQREDKAKEDEAARAKAEAARKAAEEAQAREDAANNPPPATPPAGPLSDADLENLFDAAAENVRAEANENLTALGVGEPGLRNETTPAAPKHPPPGRPDAKASALIAEAAKQGVKGIDEALTGLTKLFGAGKIQSFPGGFDEATYKEAKPHFEAALKAFQAAGKSLRDLFELLIRQFGEGVKPYALRFAKDQKLTAGLGTQPSASKQLAEWVRGRLAVGHQIAWPVLFQKANELYGGTQAEGKYAVKDAYDAAEAGFNLWLQYHPDFARSGSVEHAKSTIDYLKTITNLLPTQTKRTAEQDEFQQFSTVPALAFMANWVANVQAGETYLEPSAGIGGLAVFGTLAKAQIVVNELSSRRAEVLREVLPDAQVFTENAEHINDILPEEVRPTVVVMNPPFSATAGRIQGARDTRVGAQHVLSALQRLQPGGRLVAIVGEGMGMNAPTFTDWWAKVKAEYTVRANLHVDGTEYAKYGTTFNNRLLVIDKTGPTTGPVLEAAVKAYNELPAILEGVRDARHLPQRSDLAPQQPAAEPDGGGTAAPGLAGPEPAQPPAPGTVGIPGGGNPPVRDGAGGAGGARVPPAGHGPGRGHGGNRRNAGAGRAGGQDTAPGSVAVPAGDQGPVTGGVTLDTAAIAQRNRELTDSVFEDYTPLKARVEGSKPHPGALVESSAMAAVEPPDVTYTPNLPRDVITEGKLSAPQIEAVIYAGQAHQQVLPDGSRRGFFIGDGTGVGKGREIAGILLDNQRQGRKKHVWLSEKSGLFKDAVRDYTGIGGDAGLMFELGDTGLHDDVKRAHGVMFTTYATLRQEERPKGAKATTGKQAGDRFERAVAIMRGLKAGDPVKVSFGFRGQQSVRQYDAVIVTPIDFGDLNKMPAADVRITSPGPDNGRTIDNIMLDMSTAELHGLPAAPKPAPSNPNQKLARRIDQIVNWLGTDFDGVIVFDEAHNLRNLGDDASAMALAGAELQEKLPQARVVYVSATGATEVENLMYTRRLGLWGDKTPFAQPTDFANQISTAGLAAMELVARDMKAQGSYIARSLSYDGVTYDQLDASLNPLQMEIYDELAKAWQVVLQNIGDALKQTGQAKNSRAKSRALSRFWSTHQRFFNQVITSLQTPAILERAQAEIAAGNAVVFQLVNTNEAAQERAAAQAEAEGTELEELDFTPRETLINFVRDAYPIHKYEEFTDTDGKKKSRPVLDSKGNPVADRDAVAQRDALIKKLEDIRVPDNPVDLIIEALGVDNVAEITGRGRRFVRTYGKDGSLKVVEQKRGAKAMAADAVAFQADKKRALIFSDAGGTGFSFHSDRGAANQRRRIHFLVQPGWRADKAVQGFGRTHRSNQSNAPEYILPRTNLKAQKRFISSIARRLDQLGALTKGQRNTSSQGMFTNRDNLESKYAVAAMRSLLEDMAPARMSGSIGAITDPPAYLRAMGLSDIYDPNSGGLLQSKVPTMARFLNRLLSLTVDQQDAMFSEFEQRMDAAIDAAIQAGTFDDGMQTVKALTVKKTRDETVYVDPRTEAATHYVELDLTKPTVLNTWSDVQSLMGSYPGKAVTYHLDVQTGHPFVMVDLGTRVKSDGKLEHRAYRFDVVAPSAQSRGRYIVNADHIRAGGEKRYIRREDQTEKAVTRYQAITPVEAQYIWGDVYDQSPQTLTEKMNMIVGAILPVWDRVKVGADGRPAAVVRTQTDDGERLIGKLIPEDEKSEILKNFGLGAVRQDLPTQEIVDRVMAGEVAQLSNGWTIRKVRVSNDTRLEITAAFISDNDRRSLAAQGAINERIGWTMRTFIPVNRPEVFEAITRGANRPVVDFIGGQPTPTFSDEGTWTPAPATGTILTDAQSEKDVAALVSAAQRWLGARVPNQGVLGPDAIRPVLLPGHVALERIAGAFGKRIVGFRVVAPELSGFTPTGVTNLLPDVIFIREGARSPHLATLGHELVHDLRKDSEQLYQELIAALAPYIRDDVYRTEWSKRRKGMWAQNTDSKMREEFIGDVVADGFMNRSFWDAVKGENATLYEKMRSALLYLVDKAKRALSGSFAWRTEKYFHDFDAALAAAGVVVGKYQAGRGVPIAGPVQFAQTHASPSPWYSPLERAITDAAPFAKDGTIQPGQLKMWLAARSKEGVVKKDEIEWSGINDWLDLQSGRVSREALREFLTQNGVQVTEAVLGGTVPEAAVRRIEAWLTNEYGEPDANADVGPEEIRAALNGDADAISRMEGAGVPSELLQPVYENIGDGATKYGRYQLPGGSNYRELLLTLPQRSAADAEYDRLYDQAVRKYGRDTGRWDSNDPIVVELMARSGEQGERVAGQQFNSPHWNEPNILAHVRFNERTDAQGRKVLFIEEIQSDWAQKGKREGFSGATSFDLIGADGHLIREGFGSREAANRFLNQAISEGWTAGATVTQGKPREGVPTAPYVTKTESWVALSLKRMIRYAAENGFDRVAWATGEQQAERYDLSKHVDKIVYSKNFDGTFNISAFAASGGPHRGAAVWQDTAATLRTIDDHLGKEIAKKVESGVGESHEKMPGLKRLSGLDLKVGGEGMRAFYDKIVPQVANDLLRKFGGGKVGEVRVSAKDNRFGLERDFDPATVRVQHSMGVFTVMDARGSIRTFDSRKAAQDYIDGNAAMAQPGFDLTDAMREHALSGMPLFDAGDIVGRAQQEIIDTFTSARTFNWFHRTIGTQFHKAQVNPHFRPVFQSAQRYLQDVSQLANAAADQVAELLPRLRTVREVFERGPKREDVQKVSEAVFEGTLLDVRWTADDLRGRGLTPDQVQLYEHARAALDLSIDQMSASELDRLADGEGIDEARQQAKDDPQHALAILTAALDQQAAFAAMPELAARKRALAEQMREHAAKAEKLKAEGYAPLMRFGRYTVDVVQTVDGKPERVYFGMFETQRDANRMAREMEEQYPTANVVRGIVDDESWKLYQGLSLDSLAAFASATGLAERRLFQDYYKLAVSSRSALKRLIQRKGIAGFSEDLPRVLAGFVTSNARLASRNYHFGEMTRATEAIPNRMGDVKAEAAKLVHYVQNPVEEASRLRGFLFVNFLGGSVASALTNMTQPVMMTAPYLSQFAGPIAATSALGQAMHEAVGGVPADPELRAAMQRAAADGITEPQELHQLYAESIRGMGSNVYLRRALRVWGSMFSLAESFNRRITFAAAYRMAQAEGLEKINAVRTARGLPTFASAFEFAESAVQDTQGIYDRSNRPNLARGPIGATVMTFKQFSIAYLEFFKRLPPREKALALALLILAAGLQGAPGADDLEDIIDTLGQLAGFNTNSKKALREWAVRTLGDAAGGLLTHGVSGIPGVPIDVQARLGLGNLVPGTGLFKRSDGDKTQEIAEVFGPAGGLLTQAQRGFAALEEKEYGQFASQAAPTAITAAMKGVDMWQTGQYRDVRGRKVINTDRWDAIVKMLGIQPQSVAFAQRKAQDVRQDVTLVQTVETGIADRWARGILDKDPDAVKSAVADLYAWNQRNPDTPIRITPAQIKKRVEQAMMERSIRLVKSAPAEVRRQVFESLR